MNVQREAYKSKLKQFNSTPKYNSELNFLSQLMTPIRGEKILDYGCGLGTAVRYFRDHFGADCFGFDVVNYREVDDLSLFRDKFFFKFDNVYFMHSIAHVPDIENKLEELKELLNPEAKIYVITPNRDWIEEVGVMNYIPDPTVIKHFNLIELITLFENEGFKTQTFGQFGAIKGRVNERLFLEVQF